MIRRGLTWAALLLAGCGTTFRSDLGFLKGHTETIVLGDRELDARVVVCPALQGRVMTSTATGDGGLSYGWINYEAIASGELKPHINVYGGEDRFWLGPEGGQFSLFFKKGDPFDLPHWQTPAAIDSEPFEVVKQEAEIVRMRKDMRIANYAGFVFQLRVDRDVRLVRARHVWQYLQMPAPEEVRLVAYETLNKVTNIGASAWTSKDGLLSIWILGMFTPTPRSTVVVPLRDGPGPAVNDAYFGKVPADRLFLRPGVAFFRADGLHRSKIGVRPDRALPTLGSWAPETGVLTIVQYTLPGTSDYVNSMWELQKAPLAGDAINSYNDGPPAPGQPPLGPFYELETSSPALALAPWKSATHVHRTIHLEGPRAALDEIARRHLNASLDEIEAAPLTGR
ncbi:MAG TPA: DUF6786 family protein [Planctomycetota bacterium]